MLGVEGELRIGMLQMSLSFTPGCCLLSRTTLRRRLPETPVMEAVVVSRSITGRPVSRTIRHWHICSSLASCNLFFSRATRLQRMGMITPSLCKVMHLCSTSQSLYHDSRASCDHNGPISGTMQVIYGLSECGCLIL